MLRALRAFVVNLPVMPPCPLCHQRRGVPYHRDAKRTYLLCGSCALVFVPAAYHLDAVAEKAEYDHHENSPDDPRYRRFLGRLFEPVSERLCPGSRGLDFGCGPGPTLSVLFEEVGHKVALFDPYYAPDTTLLEVTYDFITASEVVEHLREPGRELDRLWGLLRPGGILGIMTQCVIDRDAFSRWRYKDDPTHIAFFAPGTMQWLAERWQAETAMPTRDVFLFQKPRPPGWPRISLSGSTAA